MAETLFWTLRHGRTDQNGMDEFRGLLEVPLSADGIKDAEEAGEFILKYKLPIDQIVCSDLSRAIETAKIIAKAIGITEVITDPEWRTIDVGDWEGKPKADYPLESYFEDKLKKIPGGDTLHNYEKHQLSAIQKVLDIAQQGLNVLVITHGTNCGFLSGMMNDGSHDFKHYEGPVKPGGIIQVTPEAAIPIFKKKLDENEKTNQYAVAFLPARDIPKEGTSCGTCYKFITSGACIEVEGVIEEEYTCINYLHGRAHNTDPDFDLIQVTKKIAGYGKGMTQCGTCEYFHGLNDCEKVKGRDDTDNPSDISEFGCCNLYERVEGRGPEKKDRDSEEDS